MANTILDFDKINKIDSVETAKEKSTVKSKRKSINFNTYFGEMGISKEDKQKRIRMAKDIEDLLLAFFVLSKLQLQITTYDVAYLVHYLEVNLTSIAQKHDIPIDDDIGIYIHKRATEIVDSTKRHATVEPTIPNGKEESNNPDAWWFSPDRAKSIAGDESNAFGEHKNYKDAEKKGKRFKRWNDMRDDKERKSHLEVGGTVIPIDDAFMVGTSLMMHPKDRSLGAGEEEILNCRCWCTYE